MRMKVRKPPTQLPKRVEEPPSGPPVTAPFTVLVDTREQAPYTFQGLRGDGPEGGRLLRVTTLWGTLRSGDYSIVGHEERVSIERKSLPDLFSSLGKGRARFEREMERLATLDFAGLIVEAEWSQILVGPPRSLLPPKTVIRTCFAWTQRYGVPWFCFPGRREAEIATYRLLERWWRDYREAIGQASDRCRYCGRPLTSKRSIDCGMGPWCRRVKEREL